MTGAAKRLGREIALQFARQGWDVAVHYGRSEKDAKETVREIEMMGVKSQAFQADLADEAAVKKLFATVTKQFTNLHCLVNSASIFEYDRANSNSPLTAKSLQEHMQVNLTTPLCSTLGILPGTTAEILLEDKRLDESTLVTLCVQLGRTLAGIHGRRRPLVPEDAAALPDLPDVDPMNARLLHLDFHLGNVLIRPSISTGYAVSGVVDWTCARWGPPEADLVELQVSVFALNPRARDGFIAGYRKFAGRTFDLKDVERRATLEIQRRLVDDPPSDPVLARRWKDWVETR